MVMHANASGGVLRSAGRVACCICRIGAKADCGGKRVDGSGDRRRSYNRVNFCNGMGVLRPIFRAVFLRHPRLSKFQTTTNGAAGKRRLRSSAAPLGFAGVSFAWLRRRNAGAGANGGADRANAGVSWDLSSSPNPEAQTGQAGAIRVKACIQHPGSRVARQNEPSNPRSRPTPLLAPIGCGLAAAIAAEHQRRCASSASRLGLNVP
jgi:hypothetical protein